MIGKTTMVFKEKVKVYNKSYHDLPQYETPNSVALDLKAYFGEKETEADFLGSGGYSFNKENRELILFAKGGRVLIPTGLHIALKEGVEFQVRPRSGLALKHGISIVNSPGTIDSDYRGEIGIILINTDPHTDFVIKCGDRIAQGMVRTCEEIVWEKVFGIEELGHTERGQGGFGHTGK